MKRVIILVVMIFCFCNLYSQEVNQATNQQSKDDRITVDSLSTKVKRGLPIDMPFSVTIKENGIGNAERFYLYKHIGKKPFIQSIKKERHLRLYASRLKKQRSGSGEVTLFFDYNYSMNYSRDSNKISSLNSFCRRIFRPFNKNSTLLKPNNRYSIIVLKPENNKHIDLLCETSSIIKYCDKNNEANMISRKINDNLIKRTIVCEPQNNFCETLKEKDKLIINEIKKLNSSDVQLESLVLDSIYKYTFTEEINSISSLDYKSIDSTLNILQIVKSNKEVILRISNGELSLFEIDSLYSNKKSVLLEKIDKRLFFQIEQRKLNIFRTQARLKTLIFYLENLTFALPAIPQKKDKNNVINVKEKLVEWSNLLNSNFIVYNAIIKLDKDKYETLKQALPYRVETESIESFVYSFATRQYLILKPVFGFAAFGSLKPKAYRSVAPYVGLQVNFSQLDNNIPFRLVQDKTLMQRMSFFTAITLTKISDSSKRYDLFNGTGSLLTGLGFKFSHYIDLNSGLLWFKRSNYNQLFESSKKVTATPFISISFNYAISQAFEGIKKIFTL